MYHSSFINPGSDGSAVLHPADLCVNMDDAWQVLLLCRELGLTKTQLETTIHVAGNQIADIQQYLRVGTSADSCTFSDRPVISMDAISKVLSKSSV